MNAISSKCARRALLAGGVFALAFASAPARAQWVVIDPTNLAQNVLQVARAIEQIANQIRQIEQQALMLARSPLQLSRELSRAIGNARQVLNAAQAVAFDAQRLGQDLRLLYPETFDAFDLGEVLAQSDRWMRESRSSLEIAMRAEARAAASAVEAQGGIEAALEASFNAQGQTSALQAGNQLMGVSAAQLAQIQTLIAAQGRALEIERMERIAREERARVITRRAFPARRRTVDPARSAF